MSDPKTGSAPRDHGGGLDAAIAQFGGRREDWLDLSTGINPVPYAMPDICLNSWTALPDMSAMRAIEVAARRFWGVPDKAAVLAAPGASALIARIPALMPPRDVRIDTPTYNEHAAAFAANGWRASHTSGAARVVVHPNNPDGCLWSGEDFSGTLLVIDESFCDVIPQHSHIAMAENPGVLILKSFGKFWGLAGLRLGFATGDPALIARLAEMLGPWPVSGPALAIGTKALSDDTWAADTRARLQSDSARLDTLVTRTGATAIGGTSLFRLYQTDDARALQTHLARHHVWSRIFPYSQSWLRLGLPHPDRWHQLETALGTTLGTAGGAMSPQAASGVPADP